VWNKYRDQGERESNRVEVVLVFLPPFVFSLFFHAYYIMFLFQFLFINDVNPVRNKPYNPQPRVFECPKIPKYSVLGWSTKNPCLAEKIRSKDPKVLKMPQGWSALDKLQVQWRTQERNSHFWNFQIPIRISNSSCCLHVFFGLSRLLLASKT